MPGLSPLGGDLPSSVKFLDIQIPTFTLAGGSTGGVYPVTNSTKSVNLNSAKNVTKANATDDVVLAILWWHISALITSNTTDACGLSLFASTDGGTTYAALTGATATITAASQNKSVSQCASGANGVLTNIQGNALTSPLLIRLQVEDATDPTTNALTITNIRATLGMLVMA